MLYTISPTSNDLMHYGVDHLHSKTGRGSGRYAWGSGKNPRASRMTYGSIYTPTKKSRNTSGAVKTKTREYDTYDQSRGVSEQKQRKEKDLLSRGLSKTSKFSTANNMRIVNKEFRDTDNCSYCTLAMIAREKGYDVKAYADLNTENGNTSYAIQDNFRKPGDGGKIDYDGQLNFSTYNYCYSPSIKKQVLKDYKSYMLNACKEGDYGDLHVLWMNNDSDEFYASHSVFFKKEKGQIIIYDSQISKRMTFDEYVMTYSESDIVGIPYEYLNCTDAVIKYHEGDIVRTTTPDYNYSPADRNPELDKRKTPTRDYSPPYQKEIIAYNPSYKTSAVKKIAQKTLNTINKATKKVANTTTKTAKKVSSKTKSLVSSAINKCKKVVIK